MAKTKKDSGWWIRYVVMPLVGGGGIVALITHFAGKPSIPPAPHATVQGPGAAVQGSGNTVNVNVSTPSSSKVPVLKEPISFLAETDKNIFSVKSRFTGSVSTKDDSLVIKLDSATMTFPKAAPDGNNRYIEYYRVSLATDALGSWRALGSSSKQFVKKTLKIGGELRLGPATISIPLTQVPSLTGTWLVFDVAEKTLPTDPESGFSHAHTRPDLF